MLSSLPSPARLRDALPDLWLPDVDHTVAMAVTVAVAVSVAEAATAVAAVATTVAMAAAFAVDIALHLVVIPPQPVEVFSVAVDATDLASVAPVATLLHLAVSDTAVVAASAAMVAPPLAVAATVAVLAAPATRAPVPTVLDVVTVLDLATEPRVDTVVSDLLSTTEVATVAMAAMVRAPMAMVATAWPVATDAHPCTSALTSLCPPVPTIRLS